MRRQSRHGRLGDRRDHQAWRLRHGSGTGGSLLFGCRARLADIGLVAEIGITPTINTGIAHREPGIGQVGAGIVKAPIKCFEQALVAFAETVGLA